MPMPPCDYHRFNHTASIYQKMVRRANRERIPIDVRWKAGLFAFVEDMGYAPTKKHHIRMKIAAGGFFSTNCEWKGRNSQSA